MQSSETVIDVKDLVRVYRSSTGFIKRVKKETLAVDNISFSVKCGELFGMLGPNGAGKTTTIKMMTTLLTPTSGHITVLGHDVVTDPMEVRKHIGLVLGGEKGLYYRVTARQNLRYFADLYGVPMNIREERINELLRKVDLSDRADERVEDFSRGMKQRLHLAKGLINDPEVIFLDEPTIGLDPQAARDARSMIKTLIEEGKTMLLTTHYMFEADELCDRIAVVNKGKVVALDSPKGLKSLLKDMSIIEVEGFGITAAEIDSIKKLDGVKTVTASMNEDKQVLRVQVCDSSELLTPVANRLGNSKVIGVRVKEPTLEDAYLWLVESDA
ncbi:MAG: ATP-binding cassette domain-containing protein [Euryarchaeota archaeon]|nr:ATP-binding cassette domain-containing protein [Euryarchaeota archaeon]